MCIYTRGVFNDGRDKIHYNPQVGWQALRPAHDVEDVVAARGVAPLQPLLGGGLGAFELGRVLALRTFAQGVFLRRIIPELHLKKSDALDTRPSNFFAT